MNQEMACPSLSLDAECMKWEENEGKENENDRCAIILEELMRKLSETSQTRATGSMIAQPKSARPIYTYY